MHRSQEGGKKSSLPVGLYTGGWNLMPHRARKRAYYPEAEKQYPWLSMLLDGYHIADVGIKEQIEREEVKRKEKIACRKGCSACCRRPGVPMNQLEAQGISWYASEQLTGELRGKVKQQLLLHKATTACPFLVDNICAVYPVRPLACRHFLVSGNACSEGEDPFFTRREDILPPIPSVGRKVASAILPFWSINSKRGKDMAFENGFIPKNSKLMFEADWTVIYRAMNLFDARHRD